ncbi:MAG TPA: hypothetical protein VFW33_23660 [Gemmataceae bacterium]|nr:hypothetical protein [Gemmataceae bacterium]
MAKKPSPAAELSAKLTRALETLRGEGSGSYPTLARLRDLADPGATDKLALQAIGNAPFSERAVVARKKDLAAPVALRDDLARFVAGPRVLEFALELLYAAGKPLPPWPLKKLSARLDKSLRGPFEEAVGRRIAAKDLPESVATISVRGKPALYLKARPLPVPPEVELAERLLRALEGQRRSGGDSYPVRLKRLVELSGAAPSAQLLKKAQSTAPFKSRVLPLVKKQADGPLALVEDVERAEGSARLVPVLLDAVRTETAPAVPVTLLAGQLPKPAQKSFTDSLTRAMDEGVLPAGIGWIATRATRGQTRLLFRLEDVRGGGPTAPAPPAGQRLREPGDFAGAFEEAFSRIDRQGGGYNFVSLVDLRRALPLDRAIFDSQLRNLREAGRYTLSAAEGRHGLSDEERAAAVAEDGALLLFVSRR